MSDGKLDRTSAKLRNAILFPSASSKWVRDGQRAPKRGIWVRSQRGNSTSSILDETPGPRTRRERSAGQVRSRSICASAIGPFTRRISSDCTRERIGVDEASTVSRNAWILDGSTRRTENRCFLLRCTHCLQTLPHVPRSVALRSGSDVVNH
ncbi:hypothetical protein B0H17DRAFT_1098359, partial [Mycena rosella]